MGGVPVEVAVSVTWVGGAMVGVVITGGPGREMGGTSASGVGEEDG